MNKGLEAWEIANNNAYENGYEISGDLCYIIETELKRLEELEKAFDSLSKENEKVMKELSKEIEKNRALEIIKKNELLSVYQDNGRYFVIFTGKYGFEHNTAVEIPKEEYDLLKAELRNE